MALNVAGINYVTSPSGLLVPEVVDNPGLGNGVADVTFDLVPSTSDGDVLTTDGGQVVWAAGGGGGGVDSIEAEGGGQLTGDVTFSEGSNITLTTVGNDIEIAAAGGGDWDATIVKASDESVASSTLQNDNELLFTTTTSAVYLLEIVMIYASPAGFGTPDFKAAVGEDTTARGMITATEIIDTADAPAVDVTQYAKTNSTITAWGTSNANRVARMTAWYVGAGGTFNVLWSQNTTNANPTIVRAGSYLRYRVIA